jgi:hypothetical protein
MVILNLQNYHPSRRRSNVRVVRSSRLPQPPWPEYYVCYVCYRDILCITLSWRKMEHIQHINFNKAYESPSVKYLNELNASGIFATPIAIETPAHYHSHLHLEFSVLSDTAR